MKFFFRTWKRALASISALTLLAVAGFLYIYGSAYTACKVSGIDLDRSTDFSFITGNCMIVHKDGSKVYLHHLISTLDAEGDGDGDGDVVDDSTN